MVGDAECTISAMETEGEFDLWFDNRVADVCKYTTGWRCHGLKVSWPGGVVSWRSRSLEESWPGTSKLAVIATKVRRVVQDMKVGDSASWLCKLSILQAEDPTSWKFYKLVRQAGGAARSGRMAPAGWFR